MIFHDYGNHMMDWVFENWIFMVLCAGALILLIIVFVYIYNHYTNISKSSNQLKNNIISNNRVELTMTSDQEIDLRQANFCPNCGQKLDNTNVKFCPICGAKI
jgi:uncharacterized membrane protein YvbJ